MYSGISRETLYQTFNLHNMDLQYEIVSLNLVSGHEWLNRGEVEGRRKNLYDLKISNNSIMALY